MPFSFDPATAKAVQEAERYRNGRDALRFISAFAALACFVAEISCFSVFTEWLPDHLWSNSEGPHDVLAITADVVLAILVLFGIPGVFSLYSRSELRRMRTPFVVVSAALILPPIAMRNDLYLRLIVLLALCSLLCRWWAGWAENQRPRDWKTIVAEMKRLNWGPLEFSTALTKGKASDGLFLAFVSDENPPVPHPPLDGASDVSYERLTTLLTLTLKHRYPWSNTTENWQMLVALLGSAGCTDEERERLERTWLYVHPEIEERASALIGPENERGFGPGVVGV